MEYIVAVIAGLVGGYVGAAIAISHRPQETARSVKIVEKVGKAIANKIDPKPPRVDVYNKWLYHAPKGVDLE
jgi:hypothetical protein